jgi:hypothetical protein
MHIQQDEIRKEEKWQQQQQSNQQTSTDHAGTAQIKVGATF